MTKPEPISTPGPSVLIPERDIKALKKLLLECGEPSFKNAVRWLLPGEGDNKIILEAADKAVGKGYTAYSKEALTLMLKAYWSLYDERQAKT